MTETWKCDNCGAIIPVQEWHTCRLVEQKTLVKRLKKESKGNVKINDLPWQCKKCSHLRALEIKLGADFFKELVG